MSANSRFASRLMPVLLVVAGCGGIQIAEPEALTSATYPLAYAHAICDSLEPCCEKNARKFDMAECVAKHRGIAQDQVAFARKYPFHPEGAREFFAWLSARGSTCDGSVTSATFYPQWDRLQSKVFHGTKSADASCEGALECLPGEMGSACLEGKCVPFQVIRGGETCDAADYRACREGRYPQAFNTEPLGAPAYFCSRETQTCQRPGQIGERCQDYDSCVEGAYCSYEDRLCHAIARTGESCSRSPCSKTSWCDYSAIVETVTCRPRLRAGQSCRSASQCESDWCEHGRCQTSRSSEFCGGPK